jgi:hypothetical protein
MCYLMKAILSIRLLLIRAHDRRGFIYVVFTCLLTLNSCEVYHDPPVQIILPSLPEYLLDSDSTLINNLDWQIGGPLIPRLKIPAIQNEQLVTLWNSRHVPRGPIWVQARLIDRRSGQVLSRLGAVWNAEDQVQKHGTNRQYTQTATIAAGVVADVLSSLIYKSYNRSAASFNAGRLEKELKNVLLNRTFLVDRMALVESISAGNFSLRSIRALPVTPFVNVYPQPLPPIGPRGWYWMDEIYADAWRGPQEGLSDGIWRFFDPESGCFYILRSEQGMVYVLAEEADC